MTVLVAPDTLIISMLDGEQVEYRLDCDHYVGPCPGCYSRARMNKPVVKAVDAAQRPFRNRFPLDRIDAKGRLTQERGVLHLGCFEGRVINGAWVKESVAHGPMGV